MSPRRRGMGYADRDHLRIQVRSHGYERWESIPTPWIRERKLLIPSLSEMASRMGMKTRTLFRAERGAIELKWSTICRYKEILANERSLPA